jgi:sulfur carrier protein ThiS
MQITLKLYAHLGDLLPAGSKQNKANIEVPESISLNELIDRFQIPRPMAHLVLVNGVFVCDMDRDQHAVLKPNDAVAIWPPVAGG